MDLPTVTRVTPALRRSDLALLAPDVAVLSGGSWLFSEPQDHLTGLVDIQSFHWAPLTATAEGGLEIASTCTLAQLSTVESQPDWSAHPAFYQCCTALFGSFKIWSVASVGGNVCAALPAGPMTTLLAGLDATALIWLADGTDIVVPVADVVTGNKTTILGTGDVIRSFHIPASSMRARTGYRKIALSPLGRSGAVLLGRLDPDGGFVLTVTAATVRPVQLRYPGVPSAERLAADIGAIDAWFTDAHGAADWRRAVSGVLGEEIRLELAAPAS